jgi:hypothetical protein
MSEYPKIVTGLGELTPEMWDRLMRALKFLENIVDLDNSDSLPALVDSLNSERHTFVASITGHTQIASNRFKYAWSEIALEKTAGGMDSASTLGGALTSEDVGEAFNLCEINNTVDFVGAGVDTSGDDYPSNFDLMPIGNCGALSGGTQVNVAVIMSIVRDIKGKVLPVFSMANSHDGACE